MVGEYATLRSATGGYVYEKQKQHIVQQTIQNLTTR